MPKARTQPDPGLPLDALLPACVRVAARYRGVHRPVLLAGEGAGAQRWAPERVREYATVRRCARQAMTALGVPPAPVPSAPDRRPVWPAGLVGSMTHCPGLHMAAVARRVDIAVLGIDAEPAEPLPAQVIDYVVRADELAALAALPASVRTLSARIAFVIKEAFYKAWYSWSSTPLDFPEVRVLPHLDGKFEVAEVAGEKLASPLASGVGRWRCASGFVVAAYTVPARTDAVRGLMRRSNAGGA